MCCWAGWSRSCSEGKPRENNAPAGVRGESGRYRQETGNENFGKEEEDQSSEQRRSTPTCRGQLRRRFRIRPNQVPGSQIDPETRSLRSEERRVGKECRSRW